MQLKKKINLLMESSIVQNQTVKVYNKSDFSKKIMLDINIYRYKKILIFGEAIIKVNSE